MFEKLLTMTGDGCSPWPPALQFTPEVEAGFKAATDLVSGLTSEEPASELDLEVLAHDLIRYAPDLVKQLMALADRQEA